MEALVYFFIALIANGVLPVWLPWWILIFANFLLVLPFRLGKSLGFWLGGFASGIAWLSYSLWLSHKNEHILAPRLTKVLSLPHPILLFLLVFLVPFLMGGLSSLSGILFKKNLQTNVS